MSRSAVAVIALLPMMFWGISFVWTKVVYQYYEPVTTITLRLIIGTLFLSAFIFVTGKSEKVRKGDWKFFCLLAFLSPFCYFLGESFGVKYVSATLAAVSIATIPVVTPVFAALILHERLSITNVVGLVLSFLGVGIMIVDPGFRISASPIGLASLGFAVLSAVGYSLIIKRFSQRYSSLTIVNLQNLIAIFYFLPVFFLTEFKQFTRVRPTTELVITLLLLAVLCSTVAFILLTIVIREIGVSKANIYTNTIPVFTAIFAWLIIGETMTGRRLLGMAVVLGGLFLSQISRKRPRTREMLYVEG